MRYTEAREGEVAKLSATGSLLVAVAILAVLVGLAFVFSLSTLQVSEAPPPKPGVDTSQSTGELRLSIVDSGNADSLVLVGPDGTWSTVFSSGFQPGAKITVRSNATVHRYLENNSVKIPADGGGFMTVATLSDVKTTQLSFQEADLSDTNYTPRTAYLACLYEPEGFELDGEPVPSDVSIPCHSPVLAQTGSVQTRTSRERNGDTIRTPILLKQGDYSLVRSLNGAEDVIEWVEVSEETAGQ